MGIQNLKLFSSFGSGFTGWTGVDTTLAPCCGICGANNTGLAEQIQAHRFDWIFFRFDRILRINISRFPLEDKYATQKTQAKKGLSENGTMNYLNDSILRKIEAKKLQKVFSRCWQIELKSSLRMYILLLAISGFCFIRKKILNGKYWHWIGKSVKECELQCWMCTSV